MQVDKHFDLSTGISAAATTAAKKLLEMQLFRDSSIEMHGPQDNLGPQKTIQMTADFKIITQRISQAKQYKITSSQASNLCQTETKTELPTDRLTDGGRATSVAKRNVLARPGELGALCHVTIVAVVAHVV